MNMYCAEGKNSAIVLFSVKIVCQMNGAFFLYIEVYIV
jgi:hypothetical protein